MRAGEIIAAILKEQGRSQRSFAHELGVTPQTLSERLIRDGSMQVDTLATMIDALDYKVMVVPKETQLNGFNVDS